MVYYKLVKVTINTLGLAKVIVNIIVQYYNLPNLIVFDRGLVFYSKF